MKYWITKEGYRLKPASMETLHLLNALKMIQRKGVKNLDVYKMISEELLSRKDELVELIGTIICPKRDDIYYIQLMILLDLKDLKYYFDDSLAARSKLLMEIECKEESSLFTQTQQKK